VDELKCKGCGVCISSCPARAIDLKYYRDSQFEAEIKGIGNSEIEGIAKNTTKIEN
jgi:heterodisulfide reductase subunit A-like polyferredoxin